MLKATFIGIDKYAGGTVRELTGAVRDATALWALISDSISGAAASLVTNADATAGNIRAALNTLLTRAEEDDAVILTFSGHGTNSQRLVTHDTSRNANSGLARLRGRWPRPSKISKRSSLFRSIS